MAMTGGRRRNPPAAELPEETPEQEAARLELARALYDENLRLVTATMDKKGLFRATMGDAGNIIKVERVKACPALPGTFRLICKGDGTVPTFGSLEALNANQRRIVTHMIHDFLKISSVVDWEHRKAADPDLDDIADLHTLEESGGKKSLVIVRGERPKESVSDLKDLFGAVPVTRAQLREKEEQEAKLLKEREEAEKKRELQETMEELDTFLTFEEMVKKEREGSGSEEDSVGACMGFGEMLRQEKECIAIGKSEGSNDAVAATEQDLERERRAERNRKRRERQKRKKKEKKTLESTDATP